MTILARARLFLLPALAAAPLAAQEAAARPDSAPFVYTYCAGPEALLVDERDAGLLRALSMLDERLLELPAELGGDVPEPIIRLLCDVLLSSHDLELRLHAPEVAQGGGAPVEVQLRVFGDAGKSASIARGIESLLGLAGMASEPVEGQAWQRIPLPFGALLHGALPAATGREGYFLAFGEPRAAAPRVATSDLPQGVAPVFLLELDGKALRPYLQMVVDMAGPQGDILFEFLDRFGLMEEEMPGYRLSYGQGSDRSHFVMRSVNGVPAGEALGWLVREPLSADELRLLPADAVQATLGRFSLDFVPELIDMASEASDQDVLAQVDAVLGIALQEDLFAPLGNLFGFYTSDSSGGGGPLSAVLLVGLDDEAKLEETIGKLAQRIDALAAENARGYVAVRAWEHEGRRCRSLQFPGVPVPFEPSLAIADGKLWIGATRQALEGALAHAQAVARGDAGLPGNARFRQALSGSTENLMSLSFTDTARMVRDGYGLATLACAALANAVRSPHDPERDPGSLLPAFGKLMQSARASVMLGRIEGNDIVVRGEGDRSLAVGMTALFGNPMTLVLGLAAGANVARRASAGQASEPVDAEEWMMSDPAEESTSGY